MKNFTLGLALIFGGALLLGTACGDDGDDGADTGGGTGGSTSKGGSGATAGSTSKGGTAGKGGSSSNTGGEPSNSGGEPNNGGGGEPATGGGGEPATGGGGAPTGAGGGFNNPDQCPGTAPQDADTCNPQTEGGAACTYDGTSCFCTPQGGPGGGGAGSTDGEWNCIDFGGGDCPQAEPTPGDDCNGLIFGCNYDATQCYCPSFGPDQDTWVCN